MTLEKLSAHEIITRSCNINALEGITITINISGTKQAKEKTMELEVGKFYVTDEGHKLEVLKTDCSKHNPVIVYNHEHDAMDRCTIHGDYCAWKIVGPWVDSGPVIHWDKIPTDVKTLIIFEDGLCDFHSSDGYGYELIIDIESLCDDAFPEWKKFVGKTFDRPEKS